MKTMAAFLTIPLVCAALLMGTEVACSASGPPDAAATQTTDESRFERIRRRVESATETVEDQPPAVWDRFSDSDDEEALDRRFGLLARPWIIRAPLLTRYYLEAKARAGTGLPPYLQEAERAHRSPAELYDRLTAPDPAPRRPRPEEPPEDDNGDNGKPDPVW